jgi:hypothetical protein
MFDFRHISIFVNFAFLHYFICITLKKYLILLLLSVLVEHLCFEYIV